MREKKKMIEIIPAIDIIDGKCVRLSQGRYESKKIYNNNPLDVAKQFEDIGIKRLHLVDLDGAKAQHIVNHSTLEKIATKTRLTIDFGGGLKTDKDVQIAFNSGAEMVTGGSIAIKDKSTFAQWITKYGAEKIILGADVRDEHIAINGWTEITNQHILPFIQQYKEKGINKVICTDIGKDGMLQGTALTLYKKIQEKYPNLYLIASGGVSSMADIQQLNEENIPAVIFGKAIYEKNITLKELAQFLKP